LDFRIVIPLKSCIDLAIHLNFIAGTATLCQHCRGVKRAAHSCPFRDNR
jgi:hypothetical protein